MIESINHCILLKFPQTECDLSCSYCYVHRNKKTGSSHFFQDCTPELIAGALAPEKMGFRTFFYAYSDGEPLLHEENIKMLASLASSGHAVAVTTNLNCIDPASLSSFFSLEARHRMLFFASLHYLELRRRNRLSRFFETLHQLREEGFSYRIRLCLAPEYLSLMEEIDAVCFQQTDQLPLLTRWRSGDGKKVDMRALDRIGNRSPVYQLQRRYADEKRSEFCHAGEKTCLLDLGSGEFRACVAELVLGRLDPGSPDALLPFPSAPVGCKCHARWCMCCSHLFPWGVISELYPGSYGELFFSDYSNSIHPDLLAVLSRRPTQTLQPAREEEGI